MKVGSWLNSMSTFKIKSEFSIVVIDSGDELSSITSKTVEIVDITLLLLQTLLSVKLSGHMILLISSVNIHCF